MTFLAVIFYALAAGIGFGIGVSAVALGWAAWLDWQDERDE